MLPAAGFRVHQCLHLLDPRGGAEEELTDCILQRRPRDAGALVDELTVAALLRGEVPSERCQGPVGSQPCRSGLVPGRRAIAAPAIRLRPIDHASSNGIEGDVADQRQEIALLLDEEALEATLKDMARTIVTAIEPLSVLAVHPLHPARERRLGRLEHEMEMIRHQGVRMDDPAEPANGLGEDAEEHQVIFVAEVDVAAVVAAGGDVPDGAGLLESEWSGHPPRLPRRSEPSEDSVSAERNRARHPSEWKLSGRTVHSA